MGMRLALAGDELGAAQVDHLGGDGDGDLLGVLGLDGNADRKVQLADLVLRKAFLLHFLRLMKLQLLLLLLYLLMVVKYFLKKLLYNLHSPILFFHLMLLFYAIHLMFLIFLLYLLCIA